MKKKPGMEGSTKKREISEIDRRGCSMPKHTVSMADPGYGRLGEAYVSPENPRGSQSEMLHSLQIVADMVRYLVCTDMEDIAGGSLDAFAATMWLEQAS